MYKVTKRFGHDRGFSTAFRQWRATSHCNRLHGYSLAFEFELCSEELDNRGWVYDFGGFKILENTLRNLFDHKTVVSMDDPYLEVFKDMNDKQIIDLVVLPRIGIESFSVLAYCLALKCLGYGLDERYPQPLLQQVRIWEHGANSAAYCADGMFSRVPRWEEKHNEKLDRVNRQLTPCAVNECVENMIDRIHEYRQGSIAGDLTL